MVKIMAITLSDSLQLLEGINIPEDLRKLEKGQLAQICKELREFIVDRVSVNGGHFGASLGVVELTVALHYVFNTPDDQLVWDVGHQAYGHKILTGRRQVFDTNRKYGGLSGFPRRFESEYDTFGVGHSSTSISAALGMAMASEYNKKDKHHIAVIGDGSMTAGMAFEAMNHAGVTNSNLLIVLNDNCMAIDPNVGALKDYLTSVATSQPYNKMRDEVWKALGIVSKFGPNAREIAAKVEKSFKSALLKNSNLFESLNIRYFGPVDGHDVKNLVHVMNDLKKISGPKILHVLTKKGKGFSKAETDQTKWHAPGLFNKVTGEIIKSTPSTPQAPKYQDVFGHTIVELAKTNDQIMGVTPAMPSGSSLNIMMEEMPDRAFDVGIAEQHAVTVSAGMATQGIVPFCNIYSTFMQRAYDQVVHDVCLQNLNVVFCLDRAGFAGADGATHHGAYDLAYMRALPNMTVSAPMNESELRNLMFTAQLPDQGPFTIRYPRGKGVIPEWKTPFEEIEIGKGRVVQEGEKVAVLTIGHIGNYVVEARGTTGLNFGHFDMRFVKPLDTSLLAHVFANYDKVLTVEDGCLMGGFGSAVLEYAADNECFVPVKRLGIPDEVIEQGEQLELQRECGFDPEGIASAIKDLW
jgi:1-deoxy-D-xylulose-5-phosphate synthase